MVSVGLPERSTGSPGARPRPAPRSRRRSRCACTATARVIATTGEIKPGRLITQITKTFSDPLPALVPVGRRVPLHGQATAQLHNGIAQTISFPVNRNLANDVVWTVGYNTNTSGLHPLGHTSPDGQPERRTVARRARVGHDRFPDSIIWDTRVRRLRRRRAVRRRRAQPGQGCLGRLRAGCALHRSLTKTSPPGRFRRPWLPGADESGHHHRTSSASARSKAGLVPSRPWPNWHPRRSI